MMFGDFDMECKNCGLHLLVDSNPEKYVYVLLIAVWYSAHVLVVNCQDRQAKITGNLGLYGEIASPFIPKALFARDISQPSRIHRRTMPVAAAVEGRRSSPCLPSGRLKGKPREI